MIAQIQSALPFLVVGFHLILVFSLLALIFRNSWGKKVVHLAGQYSLHLGLLVAIIAVLGSLFYSNGVGFEPCYLCWWQRVALYPLLVLFTSALFVKDRGVFRYILSLSLIGMILSLYHSYVQWGGSPLIPCDATASCTKLYVYAFNYVTIPTMSLTISVAMVLLYFANKVYENRHA
jgi:disulfide bond formation protein DsbB